jgi:hypothetical protein
MNWKLESNSPETTNLRKRRKSEYSPRNQWDFVNRHNKSLRTEKRKRQERVYKRIIAQTSPI